MTFATSYGSNTGRFFLMRQKMIIRVGDSNSYSTMSGIALWTDVCAVILNVKEVASLIRARETSCIE